MKTDNIASSRKQPGLAYGISVMMWLQALAILALFATFRESDGRMVIAGSPVVSLGLASLLFLAGVGLWKMKKWGVLLFMISGVLLPLAIILRTIFNENRTGALYEVALVGGLVYFYISYGSQLWKEIIQSDKV